MTGPRDFVISFPGGVPLDAPTLYITQPVPIALARFIWSFHIRSYIYLRTCPALDMAVGNPLQSSESGVPGGNPCMPENAPLAVNAVSIQDLEVSVAMDARCRRARYGIHAPYRFSIGRVTLPGYRDRR